MSETMGTALIRTKSGNRIEIPQVREVRCYRDGEEVNKFTDRNTFSPIDGELLNFVGIRTTVSVNYSEIEYVIFE